MRNKRNELKFIGDDGLLEDSPSTELRWDYDYIEKLIEQEFKSKPLVVDLESYDFVGDRKYKHLIKFDFEKKLDEERYTREYIRKMIEYELNMEVIRVFEGFNKKYLKR